MDLPTTVLQSAAFAAAFMATLATGLAFIEFLFGYAAVLAGAFIVWRTWAGK